MTVFSFFTLFGGLAFFLYGMNVLSSGFEKMTGGKLEGMLRRVTSSPLKSVVFGAGLTAAIQSSSAVTVMLVGLVNSGILDFRQTVGVIMGSNIGTTVTAWILSLAGINSDNFFVSLLKPENFSPVIALVGVLLFFVKSGENSKKHDIGSVCIGFAVLMYGMTLMSNAVSPLAQSEKFSQLLVAFKNPIVSLLAGAVITGIIQSSAASVGMLQALSMTGGITYGMAIPIIMGQNIGTCVTALISSVGVNKNAKRVAAIHMSFNIIGSAVFLTLFEVLNAIFKFAFTDSAITPVNIALVHSLFNIGTTALLLPFGKRLADLSEKIVRDGKKKGKNGAEYEFIDERLIGTPSVAVAECRDKTNNMAATARESITDAIGLFEKYSDKTADVILSDEDKLDMFEDKLGTFLVRISSKEISDSDSHQVSLMLHTIGDFERLGDHALNLLKVSKEMRSKNITFSDVAKKEIDTLSGALKEIIDITISAFILNDLGKASRVEPIEQVIDGMINQIKVNHVERLQAGSCSIEMGFVLNDLLTNYERISDHCSNIAVALIEVDKNSFETHEYLGELKMMTDKDFNEVYNEYLMKYEIPAGSRTPKAQ